MNETASTPDDLTKIKGIGDAIAQALRESGVKSYSELADSTPARLAEMLKPFFPSISAKRIERGDWIGQADELAQAAESTAEMDTGAFSTEEDYEPPEWHSHAEFTVFFDTRTDKHQGQEWQTRVYHLESGEEQPFSGYETDKWVNWILEKGKLPAGIEMATPGEKPTAGLSKKTTSQEEQDQLEISDLWVSEVIESAVLGGGWQPSVLRAEGRLSLLGIGIKSLAADKNPYCIELYLVETETKESHLAAALESRLSPGDSSYDFQMDFSIPQPGHYQSFVVARLLPPGTIVSHLQGPIVRVEP